MGVTSTFVLVVLASQKIAFQTNQQHPDALIIWHLRSVITTTMKARAYKNQQPQYLGQSLNHVSFKEIRDNQFVQSERTRAKCSAKGRQSALL